MRYDKVIDASVWTDIQTDFDRIVLYSQNCGVNKLHSTKLFEIWAKKKQVFYEAFGNKLIWKSPTPVTFTLNQETKNKKVDELIEYVESFNRDLADFLLFAKESFFANILVKDYYYGSKKISKGIKITRAFKYFEDDARLLDAFQTKASMILQEDKVTGFLHLSIHPLDFLTISENNHKWRSCHALDGEYRAGNLAYMCDSSTVIAYLADENDVELNCMPVGMKWNSKKWRTLLFFSERNQSVVFAGRQYPFFAETGLDYVRKAIMETIWGHYCNGWGIEPTPWYNECINEVKHSNGDVSFLYTKYIPISNRLVDINDSSFMKESGPGLFYNDLRYSTVYKKPYYCYIPKVGSEGFIIGGDVPCLICGQDNLFTSGSMYCHDCELDYGNCDDPDYFGYCAVCGRRVIIDEAYSVSSDGDLLCEDCADELTSVCESCGERYYNEQIRYDKKVQEYRCEWCYSRGDERFD